MAYSVEQWSDVRVLFESGLSLAEIVNREGIKIKSKGSISKRSNAEGWKVNGRKSFITEEVQVKQHLGAILEKKEKLSPQERNIHDSIVSEQLQIQKFFRGANMLIANTLAKKLNTDGTNATYQELNQAASTIGRTQESVLGKAPEVVINNTNAVQNKINCSPEELRRINQELEDAC